MAEPVPDSKASTRRARLIDVGLEAVSLSMLVFIATGLVAWSDRREIAQALAEAWLRDHGIEAAVTLDEIDATGFTGKARVGPRGAPVFAADRLEVAYDLSAPWSGGGFGVQTRAVRLVRPRIMASLDAAGRPRFGALQPLIDQALKAPRKPGVPGPAILVEDARLDLATPGGRVRITGDASVDDGQLLRLDGRLAPLRYVARDLVLESAGGRVSARKRGDRLNLEASLAIDSLESSGADLSDGLARLTADLPYPDLARRTARGPLDARLTLRAEDGRVGDNGGEAVTGDLSLTGQVDGGLAAFAFVGRARGAMRGGRLATPAVDARDASLALDASRLVIDHRPGHTTARGGLDADLRAGAAVAGGTALRDVAAKASSSNLALALTPEGASLDGPLVVSAKAGRLARGALALSAARLNADGRIAFGPAGPALSLTGAAQGRSAISAPDADRLAALIPNPAYGKPLSQALRTFSLSAPSIGLTVQGGRTRATLGRDVRLAAPNGATLTLVTPGGRLLEAGAGAAGGAVQVDLSGGGLPKVSATAADWRMTNGAVTTPLSLTLEGFDLPPLRGIAGAVQGQARIADGRFTLTTARCFPISAKAYALGENPVTDLKAALCPDKAPLVAASAAGWDAALRFENGEGLLAAAQARLQGVKGEARLGGAHGFERADVRVESGAVADAAPERRFNPILGKGGLVLASGLWTGTFQATTPVGAPLGEIRVRHVVATGRGQADIDGSHLVFAKGGLQPAELTPLAAFAREAQGPAHFTGVFAWDKQGATSRGRLVADRIDFTSPIGFVATLDGAIDFTSLAPLTSAPDQTLKVVRIDSLVPLTGVESMFQFGAKALHVSKATFQAAKGRVSVEPIDVPLGPDKTMRGAVVIEHLDLGELIAASSLADKIRLEAVVDGRLPFTFGPEGLRFQQGKITAIQPGRVEIARTALTGVAASPADSPGAPAKPAAQVNAIQDFAYQAMENLAFDELEAGVNSTDQGRLSILFHIKGRHDPKVAEKAKVGILELLRGRAFNRRIPLPAKTPVDLTLDTSLNFDELLAAWRRSFAPDAATAPPRSGPVQP